MAHHRRIGRAGWSGRVSLRLVGATAALLLTVAGVSAGAPRSQGQPGGPSSEGPVMVLEPTADTYVRRDLPARVDDNYGCQHFIAVGTDRRGGADAMRALVLFDLPDIDPARVVGARLELTIREFDEGDADQVHTVDVHRIIESADRTPWLEGLGFEDGPTADITVPPVCEGTDPADGVAWTGSPDDPTAPGGNNISKPDFDPEVIDTASIDQDTASAGDRVDWDVTETVRRWLDRRDRNYGLLLRDGTAGAFRGVRFGSREGSGSGIAEVPAVAAPRLVIELGGQPVCQTVPLGGIRLTGLTGGRNVTDPVPVDLGDAEYDVTLVSTDDAHPAQSTQPREQWQLEALDDAGGVVWRTGPSDDLPDAERIGRTAVGRYDLSGVVALRARHVEPGPSPNSVVPEAAVFGGALCDPPVADRCDAIGDLRDLHDCDLSSADLADRSIRGTDLTGADLTAASLVNADLWQSTLRSADTTGAELSLARLTGADLSNLPESPIGLTDADLTRANLSRSGYLLGVAQRAVLADAELRGAWLRLDLRHADLRGIRGFESIWAGADLRRADLHGGRFRNASFTATTYPRAGIGFLPPADLRGANLSDAVLSGADLFGVDLRWADLTGADVTTARVGAADLRNAVLSGADLSGADLRGALLDGADLSGVTWEGATCPDGTVAENGAGCGGRLDPASQRRRNVGTVSLLARPAPRWEPLPPEHVVEELRPDMPFVVLGPRVAVEGTTWVEVDTFSGVGWVDGRDLRPWSPDPDGPLASCESDTLLAAVIDGLGVDPGSFDRVDITACADGEAAVLAIPPDPRVAESEQVFLQEAGPRWAVVDSGTGIDCPREPPGEVRDRCARLGLWTPRTGVHVFFFDQRRIETVVLPLTVPVRRDASIHDPEHDALAQLFAGPIGDEPSVGLVHVASEATGFTDFTVVDGVARLTLTGGCNSQGSTFVVASEIFPTLTQFESVEYVKIFDPDGNTPEPDGRSDSVPDCLQP